MGTPTAQFGHHISVEQEGHRLRSRHGPPARSAARGHKGHSVTIGDQQQVFEVWPCGCLQAMPLLDRHLRGGWGCPGFHAAPRDHLGAFPPAGIEQLTEARLGAPPLSRIRPVVQNCRSLIEKTWRYSLTVFVNYGASSDQTFSQRSRRLLQRASRTTNSSAASRVRRLGDSALLTSSLCSVDRQPCEDHPSAYRSTHSLSRFAKKPKKFSWQGGFRSRVD